MHLVDAFLRYTFNQFMHTLGIEPITLALFALEKCAREIYNKKAQPVTSTTKDTFSHCSSLLFAY